MDRYMVGGVIGEGQFGSVKEATVRATGAPVALKLIRINRLAEGIPHPVAREAMIAPRLSHPFIVRTHEVFPCGSFLVFAMERCDSDVAAVLRTRSVCRPLPAACAKAYMRMLLAALRYLHAAGVLHRDVKPSNCLLVLPTSTRKDTCSSMDEYPGGVLKLGDFGLSRVRSEDADMSHEVASRWYRAPELLFGLRQYGGEVDMWSAGCIFGELLRGYGTPLFTGDGDINQLSRIFAVLGTPDETSWQGISTLPDYDKVHFAPGPGTGLDSLVPNATAPARDLLIKLLTLDPAKRLTATDALCHPYFYA